jgi:hypothetical protein
MNVVSMFYGIIVSMIFSKESELKVPHIFVLYQDKQAIFTIAEGMMLSGEIPDGKRKLVEAWIEIHRESLIANWQLAVIGNELFQIEPLK